MLLSCYFVQLLKMVCNFLAVQVFHCLSMNCDEISSNIPCWIVAVVIPELYL